MTHEMTEITIEHSPEASESRPFSFNQRTFCRYEPIEKRIEAVRVLVVDNLLRDERDLSEVALRDWAAGAALQLKRERKIAAMALENIINNVQRLVKNPTTQITHVAELFTAVTHFAPDAIVLGGTLRDFDYYKPEILENFADFVRTTTIPILA